MSRIYHLAVVPLICPTEQNDKNFEAQQRECVGNETRAREKVNNQLEWRKQPQECKHVKQLAASLRVSRAFVCL